jgi:hypothetical protein
MDMAAPSNRKGRIRTLVGKIALISTIVFGFVSIIFSRDFDGAGKLFHESKDSGVAHADAPACGSGDSGGGDSGGCDCDGGG